MTTVRQYVTTMRNTENLIAAQLGVNLPAEGQTVRVVQVAGLALLGVLIKVLVDKGVTSDAELQAALAAAIAEAWPGEPVVTPPPGP